MIESFILENLTLNKKLNFGQNKNYEYLFKDGGIDFDVAPAVHNTHTYPTQLGVSISSSKIKERNITIIGYVYYIITENDKIKYSNLELKNLPYEMILQKKKTLNEFVNPLQDIRMLIGDYYIDGRATQSVKYSADEQENNMYFCQFIIYLYCADPMFKKSSVIRTSIGGSYPLLMFPLVAVKTTGTVISARQNYRNLTIYNEGDAEVGAKITFEAKGEVKNPRIINNETGEYIRICKTMEKGEKIVVTTLDGNTKGVVGILNSIEENYFRYWDFNNTWIKFQTGTTKLDYDTSDGSDESLIIYIELNPIKFGLEAM
jgi:hypothetical protein